MTRRKLIATALGATAGASGLAAAAKLSEHYGLIPPDFRGFYAPEHALTYASQRLLTRHSMAREFPRSEISPKPFANELGPLGKDFDLFQKQHPEGFADWRIAIDGMVSRPTFLSLTGLKGYPSRSHITHLACEEGWSYIAEWTGVPLSHVLEIAGVHPQAKYVVYTSMQPGWRDSIDMADALHPQTLLTYAMNGGDLSIGNGGPLRMRVPRQLGYKSVKFVNSLIVTDDLKKFSPGGSYSWYAGI